MLALKNVQRCATKLIQQVRDLTSKNTDRLKQLNLPSLFYPSMRGDAIPTFKIVKGFDDVNFDRFFPYSKSTREHY